MGDSDYFLAGWRLRAGFPLPWLPPWRGENKPPDFLLRTGNDPGRLHHPVLDGPLMQVAADKSCRLSVPGVASYFIDSPGREIVVSPASGLPDAAVQAFLLSTVFATLCHKRGLLPLHASCVEIGGKAVAFAGFSASGKSVLAAAFMKHGCSILADDITVVDPSAPEGPRVLPSFPVLKLWRNSLHHAGLEPDRLTRCRPELEKFNVPCDGAFVTEPRRLAAIYHLRPERHATADSVKPLRGGRAVHDAADVVYCIRSARALRGEATLFLEVSRLCASISGSVLAYRPGFDILDARVAAITAAHRKQS